MRDQWRVLSSGKVKDLEFVMFHSKTCIEEKFRHNVVTTKEESRRQIVTLLL